MEKNRRFSLQLLFAQSLCRYPPVPPFEKGGRRGDLRKPFYSRKFMQRKDSLWRILASKYSLLDKKYQGDLIYLANDCENAYIIIGIMPMTKLNPSGEGGGKRLILSVDGRWPSYRLMIVGWLGLFYESIKGRGSEKMHEKPAELGKEHSFKGLVFLLTVNQGRRG